MKDMIMSFAYLEGQEVEALAYYEKRLQTTRDPNEREQLEEVVRNLRAEVKKQNQSLPDFSLSGLSLKCA
jgi:hypothetical protein